MFGVTVHAVTYGPTWSGLRIATGSRKSSAWRWHDGFRPDVHPRPALVTDGDTWRGGTLSPSTVLTYWNHDRTVGGFGGETCTDGWVRSGRFWFVCGQCHPVLADGATGRSRDRNWANLGSGGNVERYSMSLGEVEVTARQSLPNGCVECDVCDAERAEAEAALRAQQDES